MKNHEGSDIWNYFDKYTYSRGNSDWSTIFEQIKLVHFWANQLNFRLIFGSFLIGIMISRQWQMIQICQEMNFPMKIRTIVRLTSWICKFFFQFSKSNKYMMIFLSEDHWVYDLIHFRHIDDDLYFLWFENESILFKILWIKSFTKIIQLKLKKSSIYKNYEYWKLSFLTLIRLFYYADEQRYDMFW